MRNNVKSYPQIWVLGFFPLTRPNFFDITQQTTKVQSFSTEKIQNPIPANRKTMDTDIFFVLSLCYSQKKTAFSFVAHNPVFLHALRSSGLHDVLFFFGLRQAHLFRKIYATLFYTSNVKMDAKIGGFLLSNLTI